MRIGRVVGKVSLEKVHPSLAGKRYVLTQPLSLAMLAGKDGAPPEELVVLDELGASPEVRIGFSEGGEAAAPFFPEKKPVDAYAACLIDDLVLAAGPIAKLLERE